MFKKHRQDCEHPKNAQFDTYICNNKFLQQILMKFCKKKKDNYVTNPTTIFFMKFKATQEN